MRLLQTKWASHRWWIVLALLVLVGSGVAAFLPNHDHPRAGATADNNPRKNIPTVDTVEGMPYSLSVPDDVRQALGIRQSYTVERPTRSRPLVMPGSTLLDPTKIAHIRTRFNAEVVELRRSAPRSPRPAGRASSARSAPVTW